ncbi:MAG: hypothetical protein RBU35_22105, partial [Anaerolineae bacterium]|nr:hypothetical protein [Anaerolineae bacterium]
HLRLHFSYSILIDFATAKRQAWGACQPSVFPCVTSFLQLVLACNCTGANGSPMARVCREQKRPVLMSRQDVAQRRVSLSFWHCPLLRTGRLPYKPFKA